MEKGKVMEAPKKSSSVLKSAVEALSKGRHEEAVTLCKQLLKQPGGQNNYDALVILGKALFASGQYDHAETSYRRAASLSPNSLRAWQVPIFRLACKFCTVLCCKLRRHC